MLVRLDEDVALVGRWKPLGSGEISINGQVLKKAVPATQVQTPAQQPGLAAGVHDEAGADAAGVPIRSLEAYTRSPLSIPDNLGYPVPLAYIDPQGAGVLQQDMVKPGDAILGRNEDTWRWFLRNTNSKGRDRGPRT